MSKQNQAIVEAVVAGYTIDNDGSVSSPKGPLKLWMNNGYLVFSFWQKGDRQRNIKVHKFQAYKKFGDGVFDEGVVVRHLSGDPLDNSWGNIAIGSVRDNIMDRSPSERLAHSVKAAVENRRFTDEEVSQIREFHNTFRSYKKQWRNME